MDVQQLNLDLCKILDKKNELNGLQYNDPAYDQIEEDIHKLEDQFQKQYGDFLEEALYSIHDEYCPDNEVLMAIAYIPGKVSKNGDKYIVDPKDGVFVEADDFGTGDTRLIMLPDPVRLVMQVSPDRQEVLWKA